MLKLDKVADGKMEDTNSEYTGFFKTVAGNEGSKCHYPTRLDTYGCGCGHDCSYCYAKDMLVNLSGQWNPTNPKYADLKRIETKLKKIPKGTILRLGGLTDCFQPVELQRRITLETIKLMNKYGIGYLIVTKSHHVADDEYIEVTNANKLEPEHIANIIKLYTDRANVEHVSAVIPNGEIGEGKDAYILSVNRFVQPEEAPPVNIDKINTEIQESVTLASELRTAIDRNLIA